MKTSKSIITVILLVFIGSTALAEDNFGVRMLYPLQGGGKNWVSSLKDFRLGLGSGGVSHMFERMHAERDDEKRQRYCDRALIGAQILQKHNELLEAIIQTPRGETPQINIDGVVIEEGGSYWTTTIGDQAYRLEFIRRRRKPESALRSVQQFNDTFIEQSQQNCGANQYVELETNTSGA